MFLIKMGNLSFKFKKHFADFIMKTNEFENLYGMTFFCITFIYLKYVKVLFGKEIFTNHSIIWRCFNLISQIVLGFRCFVFILI